MSKFPKSRLKIALETANAVRHIIDTLEDQQDISEVLVNLACQDAFTEMGFQSEPLSQTKKAKKQIQTDVNFGFNTQEVGGLEDGEDDNDYDD
jgi:hypothetical protein